MKNLLVAEDDLHQRSHFSHYMIKEGFKVIEARSGDEAITIINETVIDLAIVDVMLQDKNGQFVWEKLKRDYEKPIIVVATNDQLEDKEHSVLAIADDFLTKPYDITELLIRIKAVFRRYSYASGDLIMLGTLIVDRKNIEITDGHKTIILPLKEFELFAQLAQYPDRLFSRAELIRLVWGEEYEGDERTVDVHIKRLRQKLKPYSDQFFIQTVRGVGYKLDVSSSN